MNIKKIREELGLTQEEFAIKIGVSARTVQNYEAGGKIPKSKHEIIRHVQMEKTGESAEEIKEKRKLLKLTQTDLSKKLGVSLKTIQNYEAGEVIPDSKKELLRNVLNTGSTESEIIPINNINVTMIPLVSQYAYAGYLCGYTDAEYIESLPKVPVMVDKEGKGCYMMFEVRGDSMEENSRDGIYEGDRLYCREIKKDLWQYKLHLNKWDFIIVHKTDGILVKRIIDHNTLTGDITIHSLNPFYEDKILNLQDVAQLFNVVEVIRGRRR